MITTVFRFLSLVVILWFSLSAVDAKPDLEQDKKEEQILEKYRYLNDQSIADSLKPAQEGNVEAQVTLASAYYVNKNFKEAFRWSKAAAENGSTEGASSLGQMYMNGQGTAINYEEAARWLQIATDKGDPIAKQLLSVLYLEGKGVRQDLQKSAELSGVRPEDLSSIRKGDSPRNVSPARWIVNVIVLLGGLIFFLKIIGRFIPSWIRPYLLPLTLSIFMFLGGSELSKQTKENSFQFLTYLSPLPILLTYLGLAIKAIYWKKFRKPSDGAWICRTCGQENSLIVIECNECRNPRAPR